MKKKANSARSMKGLLDFNESALPKGITLRNATKDDADNMFEWEMASVDKSIRSDPKVIKYMEQDVQDSIKDTKMIMHDKETIGMLTTCMLNTGYWYIGEIYIIPEYRNKGIGSALIDEEIKHHDKIKLQVAQSNSKAIKLYKSYGFEITETNDKAKMYVMTYEKNKVVKEDVSDLPSTESNDIHHNIEDWENGKSNVLWVTGLSGSGKSTLSTDAVSTYNAEHVELDNLQRAKMDNWDTTGSKLLDDYIKSKGGLSKIFTYCNKLDKITWKDIVSSEECAKQFDNLFNYIMTYAKANPKRRFIVEGVQIAMCSKDTTITKISKYPVIIKMNGPLKTEFRREVRTVKYGIDNDKDFADICKTVFKRHTAWLKGGMYLDDWKELNYFKTHIGESASVLNEVKQFPVEFDQDGNLIIYKCRVGTISYGDEVADSVKLLESYRNTNNIEGMKYELAKLWFINESIEKRLKRKLSNDEYKALIDTRATCLNAFKLNFEYVSKAEKGFNFSDYYNSTPFSDNSIKITANTLKYSMKAITSLL
jgi:ribosomal protein S18 acetylase RimI-like enzyme